MEAGFDPDAYWRQTPRLFDIAIRARIRVKEQDQQGRAWLAWHIAALPKMKRFPSFKDLLGIKRVVRKQTPDQIEAGLRRLFKMSKADWSARKDQRLKVTRSE